MAYATVRRESPIPAATTKSITYPTNGGSTLTKNVSNVRVAQMLLADISSLLTAVGIQNTKDDEDLTITLTNDNVSFYVGNVTSSNKTYPRIFQDGDVGADRALGMSNSYCVINVSNKIKYNMFIYSREDGSFYMEIRSHVNGRRYSLMNYVKVPHPTNPNKHVLCCGYFTQNQNTSTYSGILIKDPEDLTHDVNCAPKPSSGTAIVIPDMLNTGRNLGRIWPDFSEKANITIKKLIWFDVLEIPGYYQVPTSVKNATDFDDGVYKYHVQASSEDTDSAVRVAICYDTVN